MRSRIGKLFQVSIYSSQRLIRFSKSLLLALLLGNVASNLGRANHIASIISDRGDRQRNGYNPSILSSSLCSVMANMFSSGYALQDNFGLVGSVRGRQQCNMLANRFLSRIAKNLLGTLIPALDDAI